MAGPDLGKLRSFYHDVFGKTSKEPRYSPVAVLADANGTSPDTPYGRTTVALGNGSLVELDEYPPPGKLRLGREGELPPGMAIVTFACSDLAKHSDRLIAPLHPATLPRRSAIIAAAR